MGKSKQNKRPPRKHRGRKMPNSVKIITGSVTLVTAIAVGINQAEAIMAPHGPSACYASKNA